MQIGDLVQERAKCKHRKYNRVCEILSEAGENSFTVKFQDDQETCTREISKLCRLKEATHKSVCPSHNRTNTHVQRAPFGRLEINAFASDHMLPPLNTATSTSFPSATNDSDNIDTSRKPCTWMRQRKMRDPMFKAFDFEKDMCNNCENGVPEECNRNSTMYQMLMRQLETARMQQKASKSKVFW